VEGRIPERTTAATHAVIADKSVTTSGTAPDGCRLFENYAVKRSRNAMHRRTLFADPGGGTLGSNVRAVLFTLRDRGR